VATRAAAVSGLEDAYPRIVDRLADGAPEVRWTAASALGRLGNSAAVEPLRKLLTDPHSEVRRQALLSLGFLNAREVLDDIEIVAAADPSPRVRDTARQALELLQ
jgi:HEAT repeat protein